MPGLTETPGATLFFSLSGGVKAASDEVMPVMVKGLLPVLETKNILEAEVSICVLGKAMGFPKLTMLCTSVSLYS